MKRKEKVKSVSDQIRDYLESKGTKQSWLAEKAKLSEGHISNVLAKRVLLTDDVLDKINNVLGTDFKK
jgi:plasmid maintenance system antidote protein VapI